MRKTRGFTIIEFLIVVVITAIIAVIAIPSLKRADRDRLNRDVVKPFEKHFSLGFTESVDFDKPPAQWLDADVKRLARPYVAVRLKTICEGAARELTGTNELTQGILALEHATDIAELDRRLKLLARVKDLAAYWQSVVDSKGAACTEATAVAQKLDLLPTESQ